MEYFEVGGAVRDRLLGIPIKDRDWIVVGSSPEQMKALGYRPVGRDFPVFLHPHTHEEYALARTERKHGVGHDGFVFYCDPNITLEEDLKRRDLTINAMAQQENGTIIDPFGGLEDLQHKILRHVSDAFIEDPLRIFRVARFAACFPDFTIAPETHTLMQKMVASGELTALTAERVWQEFVRGLSEKKPRRMIEVLDQTGALTLWFPEFSALKGIPQSTKWHPEKDVFEHLLWVIDAATLLSPDPLVRFAALCHDLGKALTPKEQWPSHPQHDTAGVSQVRQLALRLKIPQKFLQTAVLAARWHNIFFDLQEHPDDIVGWEKLFYGIDLWRRPHQWQHLILVAEADYRGRPGYMDKPFLFLQTAQKIAQCVMRPFDKTKVPTDKASRENMIRQRITHAVHHYVS